MKRIIFLLFLVTSMQLEATTMRIKHDQVTYDYDMSANTAVVVELEKNFSGSLTIPNTLDLGRDNPVVVGVADNAFKEQTGLKKITLPESVTYIGKSAFYATTKAREKRHGHLPCDAREGIKNCPCDSL